MEDPSLVTATAATTSTILPSDSDSDNNNLLNMPSTSSGLCGNLDIINISLTSRRPIALKLEPLKTQENNFCANEKFYQKNLTDINETTLEINLKPITNETSSTATTITTSLKTGDDHILITKSSKRLNIGFSDLTYSVKTGILRRGKNFH